MATKEKPSLAHISMFGELTVSDTNQEETLSAGNMYELFSFIALHCREETSFSRSKIAGVLWPNQEETSAKRTLSRCVYRLRQMMPSSESWLETSERIITLKHVTSDWIHFLHYAEKGTIEDLENIVDMHKGECFPLIHAEWLRPFREKVEHIYRESLEKLIQHYEAKQHLEKLQLFAQKLFQLQPYDEKTCLTCMKCFQALGQPRAAVDCFHALENARKSTLGVGVSEQIQTFARSLMLELDTEQQPAQIWVGRKEERKKLRQGLQTLQEGNSCFLAIEGTEGIGKTALFEDFFKSCRFRHIPIFFLSCEEDTKKPASPFENFFEQTLYVQHIEKMEDSLSTKARQYLTSLEDNEHHFRVDELMCIASEFLEKLSKNQPFVLLLDDLHWASDIFWEAFPGFIEIVEQYPIYCVFSFQRERLQPSRLSTLTEGIEKKQMDVIQLQGFDTKECQEFFAKRQVPFRNDSWDWLVKQSKGIPKTLEILGNLFASSDEPVQKLELKEFKQWVRKELPS